MKIKGKNTIFLTLIGFPFTMLFCMVVVYIGLFGFQLPFEIRMKIQSPEGELMTKKDANYYLIEALEDSIKTLKNKALTLKDSTNHLKAVVESWQDSLENVQNTKEQYEEEIASMQNQIEKLDLQKKGVDKERMDRLAKIFESVKGRKLDSLYVASLKDETLMAIIEMAKEEQAATIFENIEPRRAAKLTSKYLKADGE